VFSLLLTSLLLPQVLIPNVGQDLATRVGVYLLESRVAKCVAQPLDLIHAPALVVHLVLHVLRTARVGKRAFQDLLALCKVGILRRLPRTQLLNQRSYR
jgi:hypothetical protein